MKQWKMICGVLICAIGLSGTVAAAPPGADAYATGQKQLAAGDFSAALKSLGQAVQADRANREYMTEYMLLRQIIQLRAQFANERDPGKWERIARTLHMYYTQKRLYEPLLDVDRQLYERRGTASTATMLAETQLACRRPEQAVATLESLAPEKANASTAALLGSALVQIGQTEKAKELAATIDPSDDEGPGTAYRLARLHAAVGDTERAMTWLVRCFESVPPSQLPAFKAHAKQAREFSDLASSDAFAEALETESKVAESSCSGGSSCGSCPRRGSCPGAQ